MKKRIFVTLLICMVGLLIIGCGQSDSSSEETEKPTTEATEQDATEETQLSTALTLYQLLGEDSGDNSMAYTVPDDAAQFIIDHPDFFPGSADNSGAMSDHVNYDVYYKHLAKGISKYTGEMVSIYGDAIDVEEFSVGEDTVTFLQIDTGDGNYVMYYLGALEDVFEGTYVAAYLLPFSKVTFENMSNAYTEAIIGAAAYVEAWSE